MNPLRKIADITIQGEPYHVSQNGSVCLVANIKNDAYGTQIWEIIPPSNWASSEGAQALIDEIGHAHEIIIDLKNDLARAHVALQREAGGPETAPKPRPAAGREGGIIATGALEEQP